MEGPGKYDDVLTAAREACDATAALLIVIDGRHGSGFAIEAPQAVIEILPNYLRDMADKIEKDEQEADSCG